MNIIIVIILLYHTVWCCTVQYCMALWFELPFLQTVWLACDRDRADDGLYQNVIKITGKFN